MALQLAPGKFFGELQKTRHHGGLWVTESVYAAHAVLPRHEHAYAFLSFLVQGTYRETSGAQTRYCTAPTLVVHPPGESHADEFDEAGGRVLNVEFAPPRLEQIRSHSAILDARADFHAGIPWWLVARLHEEFKDWDDVSPLAIEGLVLEILAAATRCSFERPESAGPRWLQKVRDILDTRFADELSLAEMARAAGVHPTHLIRVFRQFQHCTPGEYVRRRRIEFACRRLLGCDASLAEIALDAGFCDQSHFTHAFKRQTGLTPSAFRKTARAR
jgi:AraC family transcriptional regulator